jgi:Arc/MetJ-type ribon-helix-helix transcriptional regulator
MSYQISPELEKLVQQQMLAGGYQSADDLLRDALAALEEHRHATLEEDVELIAGVRRGLEDMKAGRSRPLAEFDSELRARRDIS